jgi:hypothetical protein
MAAHDYNADSAFDRAIPPLPLPQISARRGAGFMPRRQAPPGGLTTLPSCLSSH